MISILQLKVDLQVSKKLTDFSAKKYKRYLNDEGKFVLISTLVNGNTGESDGSLWCLQLEYVTS